MVDNDIYNFEPNSENGINNSSNSTDFVETLSIAVNHTLNNNFVHKEEIVLLPQKCEDTETSDSEELETEIDEFKKPSIDPSNYDDTTESSCSSSTSSSASVDTDSDKSEDENPDVANMKPMDSVAYIPEIISEPGNFNAQDYLYAQDIRSDPEPKVDTVEYLCAKDISSDSNDNLTDIDAPKLEQKPEKYPLVSNPSSLEDSIEHVLAEDIAGYLPAKDINSSPDKYDLAKNLDTDTYEPFPVFHEMTTPNEENNEQFDNDSLYKQQSEPGSLISDDLVEQHFSTRSHNSNVSGSSSTHLRTTKEKRGSLTIFIDNDIYSSGSDDDKLDQECVSRKSSRGSDEDVSITSSEAADYNNKPKCKYFFDDDNYIVNYPIHSDSE
jgi:hypothetical protein